MNIYNLFKEYRHIIIIMLIYLISVLGVAKASYDNGKFTACDELGGKYVKLSTDKEFKCISTELVEQYLNNQNKEPTYNLPYGMMQNG